MTSVLNRQLPPAEWFETERPFPHQTVLPRLVADAATRYPQRPALVDASGTAYTHGELADAAGRTAAFLRARGVRPGDFVGLLSDHHAEAVRALLGVHRAGAAYVPLDPRWPLDRLARVLGQAGCSCLLVDGPRVRTAFELLGLLPDLRHVLCIDGPVGAAERSWDEGKVQELWDYVAGHDDVYQAAGFNLGSGPTHTGDEVLAYRDRVLDLAAGCGPNARVLEIGCGSGLVLQTLAPTVRSYLGIDPSPVALARNERWVRAARPGGTEGTGVTLRQGFAHQVGELADGSFDLIVLASVVQFFPGPGYLVRVLDQCRDLLAEGGRIVVADLIDPASGDNPDLFRVPPRFLTDTYPSAHVSRQDTGTAGTGLTRRYDVVLDAGPPAGTGSGLWDAAAQDRHSALPVGEAGCAPEDLAYCIFTSGSTGQPKGVMIRHRAVANLVDWVNREFAVTPEDRVLFVTSFAFDLSVYDMFGVLAAGGSVRLVPDREIVDPAAVLAILRDEPVTFWDSAPAAMGAVLAAAEDLPSAAAPTLRRVFLSGDWIPVDMPDQIRRHFPLAQVIALGGATEATVWSNSFRVGEVPRQWPSIPYGKPMQNARYYVLDDDLAHCPVGEPGDLYIAGECLADGYLRDPRLTAGRFLPDPYAPGPGERMYSTGDRARWLADGNLEFLGRLDDQVKIRGYRIELGEVQAAIASHPSVGSSAVVVAEVDGDRHLVGYYTVRSTPVGAADLRTYVSDRLPAYMMPTRLIQLRHLPVTANGKVNRTELARQGAQALHVHGPQCGRFCVGV